MATVTMELAELDMLKRNAKETEQKLNEKLRKEIGELKQQLSDKPVKKSLFQKVFSPNMED